TICTLSLHDALPICAKADLDWADRWLGVNQINVTASHGFEGFGSTANTIRDSNGFIVGGNLIPSRLVGRVDFTKIEGTYSRTQPLIWGFSAFGSLYGQYAGNPLLVPEQCGYGGPHLRRAHHPPHPLRGRSFH